jgi:nitroimidazol reductase NimA-like FMN-containing flavoprotein (pyridoxamine 5'-phosphate oxidase superfamily)
MAEERKSDVLHKLEHERDVWVATADDGQPYLVPMSLCWDGERVILATETDSRSGQNLTKSHKARVALGPTRDVVLIDARVRVVPAKDVERRVGDLFALRNRWDPRDEPGNWSYFVLEPSRIQAYRNVDELEGRVLMKDGKWLV